MAVLHSFVEVTKIINGYMVTPQSHSIDYDYGLPSFHCASLDEVFEAIRMLDSKQGQPQWPFDREAAETTTP